MLTVGVGGLGCIGAIVARALDDGMAGLTLVAASARNLDKARRTLEGFRTPPLLVPPQELAERAEVVVECAPAEAYDLFASPAVERGRILITMSSGALLARPHLFDRVRETGGRIIVPSGGLLGFDGVRAATEGMIRSVTLITRKPPESFVGVPFVEAQGIVLDHLAAPLRLFEGSARTAAAAFPANANVAASLSLAGLGPDLTRVEIWADPSLKTLNQEVRLVSDACATTIRIESYPLADNPRTGTLTPKSVIAVLRGLVGAVRIGS